jgi:hypothetical protein
MIRLRDREIHHDFIDYGGALRFLFSHKHSSDLNDFVPERTNRGLPTWEALYRQFSWLPLINPFDRPPVRLLPVLPSAPQRGSAKLPLGFSSLTIGNTSITYMTTNVEYIGKRKHHTM